MPDAECPKCRARQYGWALLNPRHQICPKCGAKLKITVSGQTFEGYSPFEAQRLIVRADGKAASPPDKAKKKA